MIPKIISLKEKKLVGLSTQMSLLNNKTGELWGLFSPRIKEIEYRINNEKISLQIYPNNYYKSFNPNNTFEKWATVEVTNFEKIPKDLHRFILGSGLYAVFQYKGSSANNAIYQYIFFNWIPNSIYEVDNRPHFEVLGENYKNNDQNSEEEIWIPIKTKSNDS